MHHAEANARIRTVNRALIQAGYTWEELNRFWATCIEEAREIYNEK